LKKISSAVRPWVEIFRSFNRHYSSVNGQLMAAGISFYALLSLMPLLLFAVAVLSYLLRSSDQAVAWITHFINEYVPSVPDPTGRRMIDALVIRRDQLVTGGFGLLALMWFGMRLFETLGRALTTIWTGGEQRPFFKQQLVGLLTMWAAGLIFFLSLGLSFLLAFIKKSSFLREIISQGDWTFVWQVLTVGSSSVVVCAATFLVYWLVPKAQVPWKAALAGAIPATIMWEVLRQGFATFVTHYSRRWELYGSLASAVLLTFWIYCAATVLLLGAAIARTYHERLTQKATLPQPSDA